MNKPNTNTNTTKDVLTTIMNRRSIRKFKDVHLEPAQIDTIVRAAQMAPSSSFMQAYTIIGLTDPALKRELSQITRTPYVEENGHLFIFCADLHRLSVMAAEQERSDMSVMLGSAAAYQIAVVDTALAAQNAVLAAESLGLGSVIMGSIRKDIQRLDRMLGLPEHVAPLFGIAVGVPDQDPEVKPRLPKEAVYFENRYASDDEQRERIAEYDREMSEYYRTRSENTRDSGWSRPHIDQLTKKITLNGFTQYARSKGLCKD